MNTSRQLLRVAALASAVTLFTGYVYQQAGGKLLEKLGVVEAKAPASPPGTLSPGAAPGGTDGTMFAGSKSSAAFTEVPSEANLLPGSKSLIIADSPSEANLLPGSKSRVILAEPVDPEVAAEIQRLLPGSKSEILAPSFGTQPAANPQPAPQQTRQQAAQPQILQQKSRP